MKSEHNRRSAPAGPTCWQREAPGACLRIETSDHAAQLFPYQHFVTASLDCGGETEILRLTFSTHDVEIAGHNLRALLIALQDFAVKWMRPIPPRYRALDEQGNGLITCITIQEVK